MRKKVGIFGGTFDPVHSGHVALAAAALRAFSLEEILLVPGHVTPFKIGARMASDADRLAMLRLAVAGNARMRVSTIELDRGGVSYTVDTLESFRAAHPDWDLWLLLGADSLLSLGRWHRAMDIVRLASVGTIHRPGFVLPDTLEGFPPDVSRRLLANVAEGDCPDVASTEIRRRAASGESLAELVPAPVADYIARHGLYSAPTP